MSLVRLRLGPALQLSLLCVRACSAMGNKQGVPVHRVAPKPRVSFTEEELRARLTQEEYHVTQNKGTERAWTGRYLDVKEDGTFACVVCGNALFKTNKKFESGSGWPSFSDVASKSDSVVRMVDESHGMTRTEVLCGRCSAHLGHVFEDGPRDTGLRYCINGASLKFSPKQKGQTEGGREEENSQENISTQEPKAEL